MKNETKFDLLIVDDSIIWQNKLEQIFSDYNYSIKKSDSYKSAINYLKNYSFKMAILDIRLVDQEEENIDGLKILKYVENNNLQLGVIVITGHGKEKEREEAKKNKKLVEFIYRKNIDVIKLRSLVHSYISNLIVERVEEKSNILLIDDNYTWHNKVSNILHQESIELIASTNIYESKKILKNSNISLILLDLCLHGDSLTIDDRLFWEYLNNYYPNIPRIAISGKNLELDEIWGITKYGFVDFIVKGKITLKGFREKIKNNVNLSNITSRHKQNNGLFEFVDIGEEGDVQKLKTLISQGKLDEVFIQLINLAKKNNKITNEIILNSAQFQWVKKQKRLGLLEIEKEKMFISQLTLFLLSTIDELIKR